MSSRLHVKLPIDYFFPLGKRCNFPLFYDLDSKMNRNWEEFKPEVRKQILIVLAGLVWVGAGIWLTWMAVSWLIEYEGDMALIFVILGLVVGFIKTKFVFNRLVSSNLQRIHSMEGKGFIFAFITPKSYVLIISMILIGMLLRNSSLPREYLSIIYMGVGLALIISGLKYFRVIS